MALLRIASYNTADFLGDRQAAVRVVRAIAPDILCLQEVPRRLFAARRVATFAAECALVWPARHRGSGGTTILLAPGLPLAAASHHRLATPLFDRTRGYGLVRLGSGPAALTVVSIHLSLEAGERLEHTRTVLARLPELTGEVVIAGDLNETSSGAAHRLVASALRMVSPTLPTYPSHRPQYVLDVIFATSGVSVRPHTEVLLQEADLYAASDHLPIWIDVDAALSEEEGALWGQGSTRLDPARPGLRRRRLGRGGPAYAEREAGSRRRPGVGH